MLILIQVYNLIMLGKDMLLYSILNNSPLCSIRQTQAATFHSGLFLRQAEIALRHWGEALCVRILHVSKFLSEKFGLFSQMSAKGSSSFPVDSHLGEALWEPSSMLTAPLSVTWILQSDCHNAHIRLPPWRHEISAGKQNKLTLKYFSDWKFYSRFTRRLCLGISFIFFADVSPATGFSSPVWLRVVWPSPSSQNYLSPWSDVTADDCVFTPPTPPALCDSPPACLCVPPSSVESGCRASASLRVTEGCAVTNLARCCGVRRPRGSRAVGFVSAGFSSFLLDIRFCIWGSVSSLTLNSAQTDTSGVDVVWWTCNRRL